MIHDLGPVEDLADESVKIVEAGGWEIGLVRWGDGVYAVRNVCPHQSAPVCAGLVRPHLVSAGGPGQIGLDEVPILACPWHGWEFDVRTGDCVSGDNRGVKTYPVRTDSGRVLIDLPVRRRI
jgi:nitrite reductase/ring-hydroxylating ferredoxin subunit